MDQHSADLPYVVAGDLYRLMRQWENSGAGNIPTPLFFEELRTEFYHELHYIFGQNLHFLPEERIKHGLGDLVATGDRWIIPIDRVYYKGGRVFDITRRIDRSLKNWGLGSRGTMPNLVKQVIRYGKELQKRGRTSVWLLDDVLNDGHETSHTIDLFQVMGITVEKVIVGVAIGRGIERLRRRNPPVEVEGAFRFPAVQDVMCERDFYVGVPLSGYNILGVDDESVPLVDPWGKGRLLVEKAHVPAGRVRRLSRFCILQSIKLWEACERASSLPILCDRLPTKIPGCLPKERVAMALERALKDPDSFNIKQ